MWDTKPPGAEPDISVCSGMTATPRMGVTMDKQLTNTQHEE